MENIVDLVRTREMWTYETYEMLCVYFIYFIPTLVS